MTAREKKYIDEIREFLHENLMFSPDATCRIKARDWQKILLLELDFVIYKGEIRKIIAKNLGYGVVELRKDMS